MSVLKATYENAICTSNMYEYAMFVIAMTIAKVN